MPNEILEALLELGLTPIDWVDASQFSKLTGIAEEKLNHRRKKWPQDIVWSKQDGNIYFSIKGYNQWLTEQAQKRYQQASGYAMDQSKSTLNVKEKNTTSHSRTPRLRKVLAQPVKLEAT
ncbi:hypothetical protein GCM10023206_07490 [Acinetobacter puyangensis]|uniref:Excisionase n=1 Tax=Acinetobacter puyangensis TaxID=1096779 RepID=A0A240E6N8_9GAMM|nr:hypothetical protein [Acinetobacter puyangensis]SNX44171.1 hypothetical protein SAMN05421731_102332 [Acinetobacter puyangensis]